MRPTENMKKSFKNLKITTSPELDGKIHEEISKTSEQTNKNIPAQPVLWRIIMKSNITKIATAIVIIAAVLIAIHYSGGSIGGSSIVWADVMEQMSSYRPYACKRTTYAEGAESRTQRMLRLNLTQRRQIFPDGRIAVYDLGNAKSLTLYPEQKRAIERTYKSSASDLDIYKLTRSMQDMSFKAGGIQELGEQEIEGHITKGFRSRNEYLDITVWADVQTKLPVQIEYIQAELGRKIVTNEFEFDVDFDESLFSTTAPEGYTVEKEEVPDIQEFIQSTTESDLN